MKNFISALVLFLVFKTMGATYCVGPAATGNGSGTNWNNLKAWTDTPVRGDTWYLKDGTYSGKTLSTANSGNTLIIIKKAMGAAGQAGHGTDDGWVQSAMGAGQATISAVVNINSSYWTIDGQKGDGFSVSPPDNNGSHYGIAMVPGDNCVNMQVGIGNITLSHIYAPADTNNPTAAGGGWFINALGTGNSVSNITISYCLLIGWGQALRAGHSSGAPWNNVVWEYNLYYWMYTSPSFHGNPINAMWSPINFLTVRYSLFAYTYGIGGLSEVISANGAAINNAEIYGNVFDQCWCGRTIVGGNGIAGAGIYNSLIYNNTFLWNELGRPGDGGGLVGDEVSSGNSFKNNLAYDCRSTVASCSSDDYNEYVATWNQPTETHGVVIGGTYQPFTNPTNQLYTLKTNTPAGTPLGAGYAQDALGNPRTTWSRGAYEYSQPVPIINAVLPSGTNLIISGTNGSPNGHYLVLASTNLLLPRTNWTRLSTNSFNGSGNFIFTNPITPNKPGLFYLLQLQ